MGEHQSSYYPPRARWFTRPIYGWYRLRRFFRLETDCDVSALRIGQLITAFFLPGAAALRAGKIGLAKLIWAGSLSALAVLFIFYGYPVAAVAGGVMIALHQAGIEALCVRAFPDRELLPRLGNSLLSCLALILVLYLPLRNLLLERLIMPVHTPHGVIVMNRMKSADAIQRGDHVGYELQGGYHGDGHNNVYVRGGMGIERVLAVGDDRVQFDKQTFSVNGKAYPKLPHMPAKGELVVPENCWFIWPAFSKWSVGNTNPDTVAALVSQVAMVNGRHYRGAPFKRWFWRKQMIP